MRPISRGSVVVIAALTALATSGIAYPAGLEIPLGDAVWTFEGTQPIEYLGYSVYYAGNLNGDEYEDLIVGAVGFDDSGVADTGRAWVFYGAAQGPSSTPDVTLIPPHLRTAGSFGNVVGWAGNVNNDEYDDVMVAMLNYNGNPSVNQQGAVFVYYGSSSGISDTPDWTALGDQAMLQFGYGAGTASDVNGDDIDDIIVGSNVGAYVFYGSDNGLDPDGSRPVGYPGNADWVANTDQGDAFFGMHVGQAGDVNNDGYSDVWVAAPYYDHPEQDEGVVFVWHGSNTGLGDTGTPTNADWIVESDQADSYLGGDWLVPSASTAGDVNGDGYWDLLVGVGKYTTISSLDGIGMLFYGSATGLDAGGSRLVGNPGNADWLVVGANEGDLLGYSASLAGDFNGDGFGDFVIGVYGHDASADGGEGLVQLWVGSSSGPKPGSLPRHVDCFVEGEQPLITGGQVGEHVGTAVGAAGDVNGDGYDDFVTGAIYWAGPGIDRAGRVYLIAGIPVVFAEDFESGDLWRVSTVVP